MTFPSEGGALIPSLPVVLPWQLLAATPAAGFALTNGTPTILTWTAPSDGQPHRVFVIGSFQVTSALTGGEVTGTFTVPGGGATTQTCMAGGEGVGANDFDFVALTVASGSTVTIQQATAVTVGAAKVWAEIWGS